MSEIEITGDNLTRAQRRKMKKLMERVDRVTQADRRFFERFPARRHRVRIASRAEIEQHRLLGEMKIIPLGHEVLALIKNIAPSLRIRRFLTVPEGYDTDLSEAAASSIYETMRTAEVTRLETNMLKLSEGRA